MNYDEMLEYVKKTLTDAGKLQPRNPKHQFRNRFDHTRRVLGWCKRIASDLEIDEEVLYTAAIFHDIGYADCKENHAQRSEVHFREYANAHGFKEAFTNEVAYCVAHHSDKMDLGKKDLPNELVLLMEADWLDEEGALGFVWDFMAIANDPGVSYYDSLDAVKHSMHILNQDYMITPKAKEYWEEKKELVRTFVAALRFDLFDGE